MISDDTITSDDDNTYTILICNLHDTPR